MIKIELADRVKHLPPYLFATIDKMKQEALAKGVDVIDLSIVEAMKNAVGKQEHHRYPSYEGMLSYREAVAAWYKRRFGVTLDSKTEVLSLIGSKEGIGHIPFAFINPGDVVLVPSPGYPVYPVATLFAGGESHLMPLKEGNAYLPDFAAIPISVLNKSKLMFLNYPNNPTSAVASKDFYRQAIELAAKYNIILCHDAAYSEVYYDNERPPSFLEIEGAMDVGIEFHSLSKTYNMTGWRIGYAVGNRDILAGLGKIKTNLDSGVFQAIQEASIVALNTDDALLSGIRKKRLDANSELKADLVKSDSMSPGQRRHSMSGQRYRPGLVPRVSFHISSKRLAFSALPESDSANRARDLSVSLLPKLLRGSAKRSKGSKQSCRWPWSIWE